MLFTTVKSVVSIYIVPFCPVAFCPDTDRRLMEWFSALCAASDADAL